MLTRLWKISLRHFAEENCALLPFVKAPGGRTAWPVRHRTGEAERRSQGVHRLRAGQPADAIRASQGSASARSLDKVRHSGRLARATTHPCSFRCSEERAR